MPPMPHKTPGGRIRRRKPTGAATSEPDDKENSDQRCSSGKNYNGKNSFRKLYQDDDNDIQFLHIKKNNQSSSNQEKDRALHDLARHIFQKSLKHVTVPKSSLWEDHPERLVESVMGSSLTKRGENKGTFLLLDKHMSALLSFSRKLIKDVTDGTTTNERNTKATNHPLDPVDNLFVAVHILRSLVFVLAESIPVKKKETLLKLLYHLITTAGERALMDDQYVDSCRIRLGRITMAGYEGLGYALSHCTTKPNGQRHVITFEIPFETGVAPRRMPLFAVPQKSSQTNQYDLGSMGIRQLCTIALKTTAVVAKTILNIHSQSNLALTDASTSSIIYGSWIGDRENWMGDAHEIAISILINVQSPWLDLLAQIHDVEKDAVNELISYAKSAHRLLWDAALNLKSGKSSKTTASTQNTAASMCLELRKNAILLLLPLTSFPKVNNMLRKAFLECACTYSWKAATVFYQHGGKSLENELTVFYEEVDAKIHGFLGLEVTVPLEYCEYFAFKAFHTKLSSPRPCRPLSVSCLSLEPANAAHVSTDYRLVLDILQMATWCMSKMDYILHGEEPSKMAQQDKYSASEVICHTKSLTREFNKRHLEAPSPTSHDVLKRIYKIWGMLAIQKTLFEATKSTATSLLSISSELHVGAVLLELMGNVGIALLLDSPEKLSQSWDIILECHIRPISVYEKLSFSFESEGDHESSRSYILQSDDICAKLHDMIWMLIEKNEEVPVALLEKAAKVSWLGVEFQHHRTQITGSGS
jgi:hypothetical protein